MQHSWRVRRRTRTIKDPPRWTRQQWPLAITRDYFTSWSTEEPFHYTHRDTVEKYISYFKIFCWISNCGPRSRFGTKESYVSRHLEGKKGLEACDICSIWVCGLLRLETEDIYFKENGEIFFLQWGKSILAIIHAPVEEAGCQQRLTVTAGTAVPLCGRPSMKNYLDVPLDDHSKRWVTVH